MIEEVFDKIWKYLTTDNKVLKLFTEMGEAVFDLSQNFLEGLRKDSRAIFRKKLPKCGN